MTKFQQDTGYAGNWNVSRIPSVIARTKGLIAIITSPLKRLLAANSRKLIIIIVSTIVILLVIPPILVLLFSSVNSGKGKFPFMDMAMTLTNYSEVFKDPYTYQLLLNTLVYIVGSVLLTLLLTMLFAWFLERTNMYLRKALFIFTLIPMAIPGVVTGMVWILLLNPSNGIINTLIRDIFSLDMTSGPFNIYSMGGMIIVSAVRFVPLMYLMVGGVFSRIDPSFEEAGKTCGATSGTLFRRISLPLLSPSVFSAVIYFIVMAFEAFETAALLGAPKGVYILSTAIYYAVHPVAGLPNYGKASVYSMFMLVLALIFVTFYRRYTQRTDRFTTITGKGFRPKLIDLRKKRWIPTLLMSLYYLVVVMIPLLVLLWKSLAPPYSDFSLETLSNFSFANYEKLLSYHGIGKAVINTLVIGAVTAVASMLIVTLLSWQAVRRKDSKLASFAEFLAFSVTGMPSIVTAVALIFIYVYLPFGIYGSIWIIIIGLVTRNLPFGVGLMNGVFLQIHKELEEAAETCGASPGTVLRKIVMPLIMPSFIRGMFQVFVRSISDATIPLMLRALSNQTIVVILWTIWNNDGNYALACAVGVPLVFFSAAIALPIGKYTMFTDPKDKARGSKSKKRGGAL